MKALLAAPAVFCMAFAARGAERPAGDWDFSRPAEVISDRSGGGNDLRVEGSTWVESRLGKALRVPARSGRIWCEKPGEALRPAQALGISAWVRPLGTGQYCAVVNHGRGWGEEETVGYRLLLYLDGARLLLRAGRTINISGGRVIRGQWNQVAAAYDGREAVLYLNGQAVARDLVEGPIVYRGVEELFEVASGDNGNLDGEIVSLKVFDRALSEAEVAADWQTGQRLRLTPEEITAERVAKLEQCSLERVPEAPFARDRHTTLLAHLDNPDDANADYSRWEGRAGGWRLKHSVPGRFGLAVELPAGGRDGSGAPILYRGGSNCNLERGTCEFWLRVPEGVDLLTDDRDRYLLTIVPEWHLGYRKRPGVHLVLRAHSATRSLQFAANTDRIDWYSHLNGAWIADSAKTTLHLPLGALAGHEWHHVLCSWSMEGEGRIWLLVDGRGVTSALAAAPDPGPQIPCYKIFFGGSYFPEVYCPSARAVLDEFRITDQTVMDRLAGAKAAVRPAVAIDEELMMRGEDLCRHFLDFTAALQMGGGWEGVYTWPNLMPDESPGTYAAAAEDEYTMRHVAPAFLRAYEVLGDDRYLRVAENCGQLLVKTQDRNGAWCQGYVIMPDGAHPVAPGQGAIEEGTQTDPLRLLFWLWRITGRLEYREAAARSAGFLLSGQKPDGAWPLRVDSQTMKPGGGYGRYSTLNDGTTLWGMKAMLLGWHLTGERRYLEALERAGGFLIKAQLPGKACGWAEQYGDDGRPAWAREFEPPAACLSAIDDAAEGLFLLHDLSGGDRYLAPLKKCVEWGLTLPEEHRGYLYYDPASGEPITARGYRIWRFSDPGFSGARPYRTAKDYFSTLQSRITHRAAGPLVPGRQGPLPRGEFTKRPVTADSLAAGLEEARAAAAKPLEVLAAFKRGEFPAGAILAEHPRHGRHFWPGRGTPEVTRVLEYLQSAKVVSAELKAEGVPRYGDDYFGPVDPARDWYLTPLLTSSP